MSYDPTKMTPEQLAGGYRTLMSDRLVLVHDLLGDAKTHLALARNGPESDAIDALRKAVEELTGVVCEIEREG